MAHIVEHLPVEELERLYRAARDAEMRAGVGTRCPCDGKLEEALRGAAGRVWFDNILSVNAAECRMVLSRCLFRPMLFRFKPIEGTHEPGRFLGSRIQARPHAGSQPSVRVSNHRRATQREGQRASGGQLPPAGCSTR